MNAHLKPQASARPHARVRGCVTAECRDEWRRLRGEGSVFLAFMHENSLLGCKGAVLASGSIQWSEFGKIKFRGYAQCDYYQRQI